jgi:cell division protein FtsB
VPALGTRKDAGKAAAKAGRRVDGPASRGRLPVDRARRAVAATQEALGVHSSRRAVILAVVVCALALSLAVPLRNYVAQRQELTTVLAENDRVAAQVEELTRRRGQLSSPDEVAAQARSRLGYVLPGETPYVVQLPGDDAGAQRTPGPESGGSWYERLWRQVKGDEQPGTAP